MHRQSSFREGLSASAAAVAISSFREGETANENRCAQELLKEAMQPDARSKLRQLISLWSNLAETELLDIYQIPDSDRAPYCRYSDPSSPQMPHKWVFPAWSKGGRYERACPDAMAWRKLARRIGNLNVAQGSARHDLLTAIRRWRPPLCMIRNASDAETHRPMLEAVRQQRIFWRNIRLTEIELCDLEPLQRKAEEVATQLEKRYRFTASRRWQLWCRQSLANGASSIIQWCKRPERELEVQALEAPEAKLSRIKKEWTNIWGHTDPCTIQLHDLPIN